MSRSISVSRREYEDIKSMGGANRAIARISKRSNRTIGMIRKAKSYEEFVEMRKEYSRKIVEMKNRKKSECDFAHIGIYHCGNNEQIIGVTTTGKTIELCKEDMVKLFTKPIPKSKAEAIQKALKDAGLDIFEDGYYLE